MAENKLSQVVNKLCCNCRKIFEEPTKTCVGCGIARYCGKECQIQHRPDHKKRCTTIKKSRKWQASFERELQEAWSNPSNPHESWDRCLGKFWGSSAVEARHFCRGLFCLSWAFVVIAEEFEDYVDNPEGLLAMREAEKTLLELLRVSHGDSQKIRFWYPAVLLALGRLQDCYDFIHWWATVDSDGNYDWDKPPKIEKGEWLYPRNNNMLLDLLEDPRVAVGSVNLFHLTALIILKMWIVEKLKSGEKTPLDFDSAYQQPLELCIARQEDVLMQYCALVEKQNKHILPGIVHPSPMCKDMGSFYFRCSFDRTHDVMYLHSFDDAQRLACDVHSGSFEEAQEVVQIMYRVCEKFGAREKIQEIRESKKYLEDYLKCDPLMLVD